MRHWIDILDESRRANYERDLKPGLLPATPENIEAAKEFVLSKWRERWLERNGGRATMWKALALRGDRPDISPDHYEPPADLTNSCKFTSLFARDVFGGRLEGNWDHQYVRSPDGDIIDLNIDAADVQNLGDRAHVHDQSFWGRPEHRESVESCKPRAAEWAHEFLSRY